MVHCDYIAVRYAVFVEIILSRKLQGAFNGLCAAVREEYALHSGSLAEQLRSMHGRLVIVKVRGMNQLIHLCLQGIVVFLVVIAECEYGDAGCEIQILRAVGLIKIHAVPVVKNHREPVISMQQDGLALRNNLLFIHGKLLSGENYSLTIAVPTPFWVKNSRSRQCALRPSRICTLLTPLLTASMQLRSFGSIPPPM